MEFGFNGNGILTEAIVEYYTNSNQEVSEYETLTIPDNGTEPLPSHVYISGLQPLTSYQFSVVVSNEAGSSGTTSRNATTLPLRERYFSILQLNIVIHCFLSCAAPGPPTDVTALTDILTTIKVSWTVSAK